jgi:hypothetical protein
VIICRIVLVFLGLSLGLSLAMPSVATAQASTPPPSPRDTGTWLFGISTGAGHRAVTGTFLPAELPPGAGQPPPRATAELDLEGGIGLGRRIAALALYERSAAFSDNQGWGTFAIHGVVRGWITPRIWLEAGAGTAELAFRQPATSPAVITHWWRPGFEAGGGYEIFQGPRVVIHVFARYSTATFNDVRLQCIFFQVGLLGKS